MYSGARLLSDLKTVRSILYSIRAMTGSQWSLIRIGVIEAYFLVPISDWFQTTLFRLVAEV